MKTTLDLPVDLLEEAMRAGRCPTKTATIVMALEQLGINLEKNCNFVHSLVDFIK